MSDKAIPRDVRFAWTASDGTLQITQLADGVFYPGIEDFQAIHLAATRMVAAGAMPNGTVVRQIDKAIIPTDRKYREAWKLSDTGEVQIDQAKKAVIDAGSPPEVKIK